jgi:RNA polymerase sigma-70 factor, ECF subfamily
MSTAMAGNDWKDLRARLRPFVERRVASTADADDVLQEVLVRVQRGLPALRAEDRFGPWLFAVARTAIADHFRREPRYVLPGDPGQDLPVTEEGAEDLVERHLAAQVVPFVAVLPSPYREALTLTELEGVSHRDAAEMVGISLTAMKSRVRRGRARLRELFGACCQIALDPRGHPIACEPRPNGSHRCECWSSDQVAGG